MQFFFERMSPARWGQNDTKIEINWNFIIHSRKKVLTILAAILRSERCKSMYYNQIIIVNIVDLVKSYSSEYYLAKFGAHTEDNEPFKVCSFG